MSTTSAASVSDLQSIRDYRLAIAALEDSTATIKNHIEATRKVFRPVPSIVNPKKPHPPAQQQQQSKLIDTSREKIRDDLSVSAGAVQKAIASSFITIDDTLSRHDHNYETLEVQLQCHNASEISQERAERAAKLLNALHRTRCETIRTKLNRVYLEALIANTVDVNGYDELSDSSTGSKVELVKADLEALHAEINDVSDMLVSHEHGNCVTAVNSSLNEAQGALQQQRTRQATERITDMVWQIKILTERAEMLQSHRLVLQQLRNHLEDVGSARTAQQRLPVGQMKYDASKMDTTSLTALQRYLGLTHNSTAITARSEQIELFNDFMSHVSSSLAIQAEQSGVMQGAMIRPDRDDDSHSVAGSAHSLKLNNLDNEIAEVKARMDTLPR